jgi:hypothetical protein
VALTATINSLDIELADVARGVYEGLALRLLVFFLFLSFFSVRNLVLYDCACRARGHVPAARLQRRRTQHERQQEPPS